MATPRVYFVSLGCPKNRIDTEVMLGLAEEAGYGLAPEPEEADVIVVNTCGFIGDARRESIETVLELARYKEQGRCRRLVVTGCLAQGFSDELSRELPEVDCFLGAGDFPRIAEALRGALPRESVSATPSYLYDHRTPRRLSLQPYTAYVKVSEGCDRQCAFCVIPTLRGRQRSRDPESVVAEVAALCAGGVTEVSLVAQDLTDYGSDLRVGDRSDHGRDLSARDRSGHRRDLSARERTGSGSDRPNRPRLAPLVRRLASTPGLRWLRLHYAYPTEVDDELLEVIATCDTVCAYLDVPFQHIDDGVLRAMRRGHGKRQVRELLDRVRRAVPGIVLRTSFLVGHPGETPAAFRRLVDFVAEADLDHVGVFTFSPEEGTPAVAHPGPVPEAEARRRAEALTAAQAPVARRRRERLVGHELEVLVEGLSPESDLLLYGRHAGQAPEIDGGVHLAMTEEMVDDLTGPLAPGTFVRARITQASEVDLVGEIVGVAPPPDRGRPG